MDDKPLLKRQDGIVEGRESLFSIVRGNSSGGDDRGNEKCLVDIDATADGVNDFHGNASFQGLKEDSD